MKNREIENQLLYSVFARNHTEQGTLEEVTADLERIKNLGTDILWLMPVQPTGIQCRKGKDGSPYAISDYRTIDPRQGTWQSLMDLTEKAHQLGMKVIVDVVYNHTSPDSVLTKEHPHWFYTDESGNPSSIVEEWSDIVDLNYNVPELWDYQIETLKQFAAIVDGFRVDVASRVPAEFWVKARKECDTVKKDLIWLAESCHLPFIKFCRDMGRTGESESALCQAFDVLYDYDAYPVQWEVMQDKAPISLWTEALERQDAILPADAIKMRYLENHDQPRCMSCKWSDALWKNWTALLFTLKGLPMLYHGQEQKEEHLPSIFTQDPIQWNQDKVAEDWIRNCLKVRREYFKPEGPVLYEPDDTAGTLGVRRNGMYALFALQKKEKKAAVKLSDGSYTNLFDGKTCIVKNGEVNVCDLPLLVKDPAGETKPFL